MRLGKSDFKNPPVNDVDCAVVGAVVGAGAGAGVDAGVGAGVDAGVGAGVDAGVGADLGAGVGAGDRRYDACIIFQVSWRGNTSTHKICKFNVRSGNDLINGFTHVILIT